MDIEHLVNGLISSDNKYAYQCLKQLEEESARSSRVYPYFDLFAEMLDNASSYIRTRGILLIAANAKWDTDHKIDGIIGKYLKHMKDVKPITARQCIQSLPVLVRYRPNLKDDVVSALYMADPLGYKDSMQPLLLKDIQTALNTIQRLS